MNSGHSWTVFHATLQGLLGRQDVWNFNHNSQMHSCNIEFYDAYVYVISTDFQTESTSHTCDIGIVHFLQCDCINVYVNLLV